MSNFKRNIKSLESVCVDIYANAIKILSLRENQHGTSIPWVFDEKQTHEKLKKLHGWEGIDTSQWEQSILYAVAEFPINHPMHEKYAIRAELNDLLGSWVKFQDKLYKIGK